MYGRKENIEVEKLDWECHISPSPVNKEVPIKEVIPPSLPQQDEIPFHEKNDSNNNLDIIKKATHYIDENSRSFFIFALLIFPYMVGFFLSYFLFYLYGDMSMADFLIVQQEHPYIESWGIGMYLLITVGVIWIVIKSLFGSSKNLSP